MRTDGCRPPTLCRSSWATPDSSPSAAPYAPVVLIIAQESGGGAALSGLLFPLLLVVAFYLLLIRPQRARSRQMAQVRNNLEVGRQVITNAGLHARVAEIGDDGTVLLEIAPGVQARFASQAIVRVLDEPGEPGAETSEDDDNTPPPA